MLRYLGDSAKRIIALLHLLVFFFVEIVVGAT